jgi:hypothetical protein
MTIQHSAIEDADRHEPKGITTAAAGTAYIADGGGSTGAWEQVQREGYSCMKCVTTGATTGITTAYQEVNNATVGGTCTWSTNIKSSEVTHNLTDGYFTTGVAGVYNVNASINFIPAGADTYSFTLGIDAGAGIVDKSSNILAKITVTASATGDTRNVVFTCLPSLGATDKVYIMVKSAGGAEITITHINFVAIRAS